MNSPSDTNSRNATPAGGQNESINSSPVHGPRPARIEGWPKVAGYCPACGTASLFLGSGGWVTCSLDKCPNPTAVADLIEHRPDLSVPPPQPNPSVSVGDKRNGYPCQKDGATLTLLPGGAWCPECHTVWREIADLPMTGVAPPPRPVVSSARVDLDLEAIEARRTAVDEATNCPPDRWAARAGSAALASSSDVPALVAEVRRLRETLAMANYACEQANRLTAGQKKLTDKAAAERDAARAEAVQWRENAENASSYRAAAEDERDEARAEIERLRSEHVGIQSYVDALAAERAEAARVREALQAVRDLHCECTTGNCACGGGPGWCHGCDGGWPCSTVRALDAALGSHPDESENPTKEMDHA